MGVGGGKFWGIFGEIKVVPRMFCPMVLSINSC